jgi:hypothetical protein
MGRALGNLGVGLVIGAKAQALIHGVGARAVAGPGQRPKIPGNGACLGGRRGLPAHRSGPSAGTDLPSQPKPPKGNSTLERPPAT